MTAAVTPGRRAGHTRSGLMGGRIMAGVDGVLSIQDFRAQVRAGLQSLERNQFRGKNKIYCTAFVACYIL